MIRSTALSRSTLRTFPRFAALAMALGGATAFIGCFAEPAQTETTEEVGTAEQALVRCRVCVDSTSCYDDYCDTRIEYCDHTIGCVPYDSGP